LTMPKLEGLSIAAIHALPKPTISRSVVKSQQHVNTVGSSSNLVQLESELGSVLSLPRAELYGELLTHRPSLIHVKIAK